MPSIKTHSSQELPQSRPARRPVLRMDAQDGPWTVSVAENPHDPASSYSLYVKTPTHNLTLSRTSREIIELHTKLHDAHPAVALPHLPIQPAPALPPKRKSAFLNTLSRLASPSSKSANGRHTARAASVAGSVGTPSGLPTPVATPGAELVDPFAAAANGLFDSPASTATNPTVTGLAAYLTTISNDQLLRQTRVWKRFVRVRTDDLESVRVERAIKRVRSDLAAHMTSPSTVDVHVISSVSAREITLNDIDRDDGAAQSATTKAKRNSRLHEDIVEEDARDVVSIAASTSAQSAATADDRPETPRSPKASVASTTAPSETSAGAASSAPTNGADEEGGNAPTTPVAAADDSPAARLPRSQSADVAASARLSRALTASSSALGSATASASASHTGDDASTHTSSDKAARPRPRPKRSQSADPNRARSLLKKSKSHPNAQAASSSSSSTAAGASQASTPGGTLSQRKVQVSDFEMMRVLGKGCAGKVLLVRYKSSADLYALKAITKRHVLAHQELQHTLTEQAVLKRMAAEGTDPFVVKLWWSFHDKENLFLVMDFHPGGDLATQLARWGRLGRDRARFYAAEIVEGVEGLHAAGVIYRDLKPENILIAADGHIVLTDFGLSKEFPRRAGAPALAPPSTPGGRGSANGNGAANGFATPPGTPYWMANGSNGSNGGSGGESPQDLAGWPARATDSTSTFCGTAEYLAPEVIQGLPYSYEVDWWSFGTMLYEMLTGITPFWADNHSDMYVRVLQDELQFPDDRAMDQDTKSLIRGLLQRNPALRLSEPRIKRHPYFSMIDWSHVYHKRYIPPYIPPIDPSNASDTQNFDDTFLDMEPVINDENDLADTDAEREQTDTDRTDGEDSLTTPSQSRSSSVQPAEDASVDVFDGYSFKGRHSVILDEEEDEDEDEDGEDEEEMEMEEGDDDSGMTPSILAEVNGSAEPSEMGDDAVAVAAAAKEETPEPKTPEARPTGLPAIPAAESAPAHPGRVSSETTRGPVRLVPRVLDSPPRTPQSPTKALAPEPARAEPPRKEPSKPKEKKGGASSSKPAPARAPTTRTGRRREKSGIPALDRDLSDAAEEDEAGTERDEDEDDWDFIEADGGEDRNGAKATSLFARGVVDRYKLAVFRKGSTPNRAVSGVSGVSGVSSQASASDAQGSEYSKSPSPQEKQRRGRAPGLTFRRTPKPFLGGAKSPPASTRSLAAAAAAGTGTGAKTLSHSTSATLSASASTGTGASLHPSSRSRGTLAVSPSLKSKESAVSIGSPHSSSDTSMNDDGVAVENDVAETMRVHSAAGADESEKQQHQQHQGQQQKNKKLKKYKEGAEKVLSLFASPR